MEEVRVVNELTGGQKGSKALQMSYIPNECLREILKLYHEGAKKYAKDNWKKGYDWSLSYDAAHRHLMQFWDGEKVDEETGCSHLASVAFHAIALMYFEKNHPSLDDRPGSKEANELQSALTLYHAGDIVDFVYGSELKRGEITYCLSTHAEISVDEDVTIYSVRYSDIKGSV